MAEGEEFFVYFRSSADVVLPVVVVLGEEGVEVVG